MMQYHVAISFASENTWIARDIYDFLEEVGYAVYFSGESPDKAKGRLGAQILEIYDASIVNVMIHSSAYCSQPKGSIVNLEQKKLFYRHVQGGEEGSLYILKVDDTEVISDFFGITYHSIDTCGIYGARKMILARLHEALNGKENPVKWGENSVHPRSQQKNRGPLRPCEFTIPEHYTTDALGRWKRLGDVLVSVVSSGYSFDEELHVYLIPSGRVPPYLSNSKMIHLYPDNLKKKRDISRLFIKAHKNNTLKGEMFFIEKDGMYLPHVYSKQFDEFLNNAC